MTLALVLRRQHPCLSMSAPSRSEDDPGLRATPPWNALDDLMLRGYAFFIELHNVEPSVRLVLVLGSGLTVFRFVSGSSDDWR